ncbi:toll-like receptor 5 [Brachionichthys hirsutus]|uniref:toll-like receptor 5 n=1 Tax=Brachionichthys hirsutus TaxID=412623 RepID=UPI00360437B7
MRTPDILVAVIGLFLQVSGSSSCLIAGSVADCSSQKRSRIPPLPPHITHLYLQMNHISEINATSLSGLEELQELDLGFQRVPLVIRSNAFSGNRRLRKLVLGFNVNLRLEPGAFAGLSGLEALFLDYCRLQDSILKENYLEPLSSLETLDLFGNRIKRVQPAMFFVNMTRFKRLNLKLNQIDRLCEPDLAAFQGKHLEVLNLDSVRFKATSRGAFSWQKCGNPFRGMSVQRLYLSNNGLTVGQLEQLFRAIDGTKIAHLKMSGHIGRGLSFSNLPDPDRGTFEGLRNSSIRTLDLSKNRIFALQPGVFGPLDEVEIIDVSQNRVNQIHKNAFEGLAGHLKVLNLSNNLLGEIYAHSFASLTNLKVLDLSYNHIGALGFRSFSGLPHLGALFLTGNSLRELGFPSSLPGLTDLRLDDNKLTSSPVRALAQFASNLKYLNIGDNRLTELGDLNPLLAEVKALETLFYGGNSIRWCVSKSAIGLNSLTVLDLHGSSLQSFWSRGKCLDLFDNLGRLAGLNLSSNALRTLPKAVFKGLSSLVELDLSFNTLTYLQADVLPQSLKLLHLSNNFIASPDPAAFRSLLFLDLKMNRFHCDANLQGFLTWMSQTNVTFLSPVEDFRCEFPSGSYDVPLLDYSADVNRR